MVGARVDVPPIHVVKHSATPLPACAGPLKVPNFPIKHVRDKGRPVSRTAPQAIIIDPVVETRVRDADMASEMGLNLKLILNTHVHADHITGSGELKKMLPGTKSVLSEASGGQADVKVCDGDKIRFGSRSGLRFFFRGKVCPHSLQCPSRGAKRRDN